MEGETIEEPKLEFGITAKALRELFVPTNIHSTKSACALMELGGTKGLLEKLQSDPNGLAREPRDCSHDQRVAAFGKNEWSEAKY